MSYILIILGYYSYTTAVFDDKASCEAAAITVKKILDVDNITASFRHAFCVPQGGVK